MLHETQARKKSEIIQTNSQPYHSTKLHPLYTKPSKFPLNLLFPAMPKVALKITENTLHLLHTLRLQEAVVWDLNGALQLSLKVESFLTLCNM